MERGLSIAGMAWLLAMVSIALGLAAAWNPARGAEESCPTTGDQAVTVTDVTPRLEPRLADGRVLRLVGLDPASPTPTDPDLADATRAALATRLAGRAITIRVLADTPDRWGRITAWAFASGATGAPEAVAPIALMAGLGRYLAESAARPCRDTLLAAEGAARQAKLGLWADPYYAVLAVDDAAAFAEQSGTNVLVEGRLIAVEPGPYRTTLRLAARDWGPYAGRALSAAIPPRAMKTFEAKGLIFSSLIGRTLRLRGLLDLRFGPRIELAGPDDVEVVAAPSGMPAPSRAN